HFGHFHLPKMASKLSNSGKKYIVFLEGKAVKRNNSKDYWQMVITYDLKNEYKIKWKEIRETKKIL
ncbi:hypothetical protein, partial [Geobacillus sp. PA-3]|uniref:hypothetical protein n=1 Tax=Geobacillus sp. PA-3 TaxID=1699078 RepID=UPI000B0FB441